MTTSVAIYTRLSSDTPGRQQTATKRQERDCRVFAQLRGWDVSGVYEDVDLSAYKKGVTRPAYESFLRAIETHRVSPQSTSVVLLAGACTDGKSPIV